jgi:cytochrome P450
MAINEKPSDTPVPTGVALTALDPAFREDPHPVLDGLRRREPVHYDAHLKRWILTRHDDIAAVLRDRAHSVDPHKGAVDTYASVHLARTCRRLHPWSSSTRRITRASAAS